LRRGHDAQVVRLWLEIVRVHARLHMGKDLHAPAADSRGDFREDGGEARNAQRLGSAGASAQGEREEEMQEGFH